MKTGEGKHLKDDLSNYDSSKYEKPSVTVDVCICAIIEGNLSVLLIKRKYPPFRDKYAIPGGFVDITLRETLLEAAKRELFEETGIKGVHIEQLKSYGDPGRDPRMRVITVAYFALLREDLLPNIQAGDDAKEVEWFPLKNLPELAFDHNTILEDLQERLKGKISYTPIAFHLVSSMFTWKSLQRVYEIILNKKLVASNFRRDISKLFNIKKLSLKEVKREVGRKGLFLKYVGQKTIF